MGHGKVRLTFGGLLRSRWKTVWLGVLVIVVQSGLNLAQPWLMKIMVDEALPAQNTGLLAACVAAVVAIPAATAVVSAFSQLSRSDVSGEIADGLRMRLLKKAARLSPKEAARFKQGDLAGRITRSCTELEWFLRTTLFYTVPSFFKFPAIAALAFWMNWKLTAACLCFMPLFLWVSWGIFQKNRELGKKISKLREQYDSLVAELIAGLKTVQMYGRERREIEEAEKIGREYRARRRTELKQRYLFSNLYTTLLNALGMGILFAVGVWLILKGELTIGELIAFTVYIPQLFIAGDWIKDFVFEALKIRPELKRLEEILNLPEENADHPDAAPLTETEGHILFRHVSFRYQPEVPTLRDVSFEVRPGEFIGIVGPTGGGKTTILDLIMRFYRPDQGNILLDGRDLSDLRLSDLRNKIGMVSQDIFLWNRSIRENLSLVRDGVSEDEIMEVLRIARLDELVRRLPEGLDTVVGDRGVKLSGGEKQRLAIARTLLRRPAILLLDEPTSALDAVTESALQEYLEKVYQGRSVIVVAHRLSTVRRADRILVISDGMVEEQGTHEELMEKRGRYYRMYAEQAGERGREMNMV